MLSSHVYPTFRMPSKWLTPALHFIPSKPSSHGAPWYNSFTSFFCLTVSSTSLLFSHRIPKHVGLAEYNALEEITKRVTSFPKITNPIPSPSSNLKYFYRSWMLNIRERILLSVLELDTSFRIGHVHFTPFYLLLNHLGSLFCLSYLEESYWWDIFSCFATHSPPFHTSVFRL